MIKVKLILDTDKMVDSMSDRIIELLSDSEELERLTPKEVVELSNILCHSLRSEFENISELDLVAR